MHGLVEYLVAVASALTVAIVGAMAAGARAWAKGMTTQINGLGRRLDRQVQRVDKRVQRLAQRQGDTDRRVVRLETVLLLAPTPPEGARAALDALIAHGGLNGTQDPTPDDLGADPLDPLDPQGQGAGTPAG